MDKDIMILERKSFFFSMTSWDYNVISRSQIASQNEKSIPLFLFSGSGMMLTDVLRFLGRKENKQNKQQSTVSERTYCRYSCHCSDFHPGWNQILKLQEQNEILNKYLTTSILCYSVNCLYHCTTHSNIQR